MKKFKTRHKKKQIIGGDMIEIWIFGGVKVLIST